MLDAQHCLQSMLLVGAGARPALPGVGGLEGRMPGMRPRLGHVWCKAGRCHLAVTPADCAQCWVPRSPAGNEEGSYAYAYAG